MTKKPDLDQVDLPYEIKLRQIGEVKLNPSNPRVIEDARFKQLVQSIKEAPWMLKIRPIVTNKDGIVLGGNQRLKACREAGLEKVWVIDADDLDDDMQREFLIKDNVDFGKWDREMIKVHFGFETVAKWGLDFAPIDANIATIGNEESTSLNSSNETSESEKKLKEVDVDAKFFVEVICNDETHQKEVFQLIQEMELECRLLTL